MDLMRLRSIARFRVGDRVHLYGFDVWQVSRRYWSRREQAILYELAYPRTSVTAEHIQEAELRPATH